MPVMLSMVLISLGGYWIWSLLTTNSDRLFKGFLFVLWMACPLLLIFVSIIASKLDDTLAWSWWTAFIPIWILHGLILLTSPIFFIYFPDKSFLEDRVGTSFGKSIKPRYRVNLLFLTAAVLNIPTALFSIFLCLHLQYHRFAWPVVFGPLFVAEIFALGGMFPQQEKDDIKLCFLFFS